MNRIPACFDQVTSEHPNSVGYTEYIRQNVGLPSFAMHGQTKKLPGESASPELETCHHIQTCHIKTPDEFEVIAKLLGLNVDFTSTIPCLSVL